MKLDLRWWVFLAEFALIFFVGPGCGENSAELTLMSSPPRDSRQDQDHSGSALKFPDDALFDFGPTVARDQTLTHDFTILNPTDKPIALTSATSWVPCCSKVLPVAGPIPAQGTGKVTVEFKPGFQTGKRRLTFEVHTSEPESPGLGFAILADLTSAFDVKIANSSDRTLPLNRPGHQSFEVVCRKVGEDGRDPVQSVEAAAPLTAEFDGPAIVTNSAGVRQSSRKVMIRLPASSKEGLQRGEFTLVWPDGSRRNQLIDWKVEPLVTVTPAGLTLRSSAGLISKDVVIQATDRPFRILGVDSVIVAEPPRLPVDSARLHPLKLSLDLSRLGSSQTGEIIIKTDHPDHPTLKISVLILPETRGNRP